MTKRYGTTSADKFADPHTSANNLMTALDNVGITSEQDWENEKTTWTFGDGSQIVVSGNEWWVDDPTEAV